MRSNSFLRQVNSTRIARQAPLEPGIAMPTWVFVKRRRRQAHPTETPQTGADA